MADIVRIQVHKNLQEVLEDLRRAIAGDMKAQFGISQIEVPRTLSSQILAAKHKGKKVLNYRVRKTGKGKGVLELL